MGEGHPTPRSYFRKPSFRRQSRAPKKLVLLDLAHPVADPFGGVLRNDAAAHLDALLKARVAAGTLPFPVLTLSTPLEPSADCAATRLRLFESEGWHGERL